MKCTIVVALLLPMLATAHGPFHREEVPSEGPADVGQDQPAASGCPPPGSIGDCADLEADVSALFGEVFATCESIALSTSAMPLCLSNQRVRDELCVCTCKYARCTQYKKVDETGTTHPYPATTPTSDLGLGGLECFSADDTLVTEGGDVIKMQDASIGTLVQVPTGDNAVEYQPIKFFSHQDPTKRASFLRIQTQGGSSVTATGSHLVYRSDCHGSGARQLVMAKMVQEGDCLLVADKSDSLLVDRIVAVEIVEKTGIFAPVTSSGSVMVNGVAASCFAEIPHEPLLELATRLVNWLPTWLLEPVAGEVSPMVEVLLDTALSTAV